MLPWWLKWWRLCLPSRRHEFDPWVGTITWRRESQSTPVFLPEEFHGQRSLAGYSPWHHKESNTTEWLTHTPMFFQNQTIKIGSYFQIFNDILQIGFFSFLIGYSSVWGIIRSWKALAWHTIFSTNSGGSFIKCLTQCLEHGK